MLKNKAAEAFAEGELLWEDGAGLHGKPVKRAFQAHPMQKTAENRAFLAHFSLHHHALPL